mmetsp:Transcript_13971/g.37586  ORF Transcript_13971/g.37586 Transcript_13971/m.37586 type:complete len:92 (-) Transcript_13971:142-417(-)
MAVTAPLRIACARLRHSTRDGSHASVPAGIAIGDRGLVSGVHCSRRTSAQKAGALRATTWTCAACTCDNDRPLAHVCAMCGERRPLSPGAP